MRVACLRALESISLNRYDIIARDLPRVVEITAWLGYLPTSPSALAWIAQVRRLVIKGTHTARV
ncbi:hypothetical protein FIBSPDRAFT_506799 [Athelia psychrophila]|uniref:Uncharacterized protein n=1 Tax=Athelia psychrophila TaxID=1759441 RepID=A0A166K0J5_9AGAM|nr:hypothetical protein FIBSPDRAFT_506799 [Fibularhizoctonia sp. CBS 109695]